MIDVEHERVLSLAQACRLPHLQREGRRPHFSTLYRWATRGVRARGGGERVSLESVAIGGTTCTTVEAVVRFIERVSGLHRTVRTAPRQLTPRVHQRRVEQAEAELHHFGIREGQ